MIPNYGEPSAARCSSEPWRRSGADRTLAFPSNRLSSVLSSVLEWKHARRPLVLPPVSQLATSSNRIKRLEWPLAHRPPRRPLRKLARPPSLLLGGRIRTGSAAGPILRIPTRSRWRSTLHSYFSCFCVWARASRRWRRDDDTDA